MAVKSEKIYSPQNYLLAMTGNCYIYPHDMSVIEFIESVLNDSFEEEYWSYPLSEIDHILENNLNVVLVDCTDIDENGDLKPEYRWFEVSENFKEDSE